jgi:two-component system phosphate regulon response regulator PhoB
MAASPTTTDVPVFPSEAAPTGQTAPAHTARAGQADQTGRGRVLIAEDEPGLAEILAVHLLEAGYEPIIAGDGLQALYALDAGVRVVLLDLHLPQVSGFRLIQLIKQRIDSPRIPVIVITALSFQEAEEAVRAGADDFITKPFIPVEIVHRVDRLLARTG